MNNVRDCLVGDVGKKKQYLSKELRQFNNNTKVIQENFIGNPKGHPAHGDRDGQAGVADGDRDSELGEAHGDHEDEAGEIGKHKQH